MKKYIRKWLPLLIFIASPIVVAVSFLILALIGKIVILVTGDPSGGAWVGYLGFILNIPLLAISLPWPFLIGDELYYGYAIGLLINGVIASLIWQKFFMRLKS